MEHVSRIMPRRNRARLTDTWCLGSWWLLLCVVLILTWISADSLMAQTRGLVFRDQSSGEVWRYRESHALLIGVSDYTAGWPDLESVPRELDQVEKILDAQGFQVVTKLNPNALELKKVFEDFISQYGYVSDNRLLFYFSGHGHSWEAAGHGYLVPADAPRPTTSTDNPGPEFLSKALHMSQILAWSRQITAKHALFLFDSCFSGTVFKMKALPKQPPHISRATALPVRQFITAGSAGEQVPARSVFTPAFVDALAYGWGDMNKDGYITGVELGLYLEAKVPQHAQQSPQFGKHPDYPLAQGDFVFALADSVVEQRPAAARPPPKAKLVVRSNVSRDALYIDGEARGSTGPMAHEVAPGNHVVRVSKKGYEAYEVTVDVAAGDEKVIQALLRADRELDIVTPPVKTDALPEKIESVNIQLLNDEIFEIRIASQPIGSDYNPAKVKREVINRGAREVARVLSARGYKKATSPQLFYAINSRKPSIESREGGQGKRILVFTYRMDMSPYR